MHTAGYQSDTRSVMSHYKDGQSTQLEKRARIDLLDMKEKGLGEATIFFNSTIIIARMFYADPTMAERIRLNHFLKVDKPDDKVLVTFYKGLQDFEKVVKKGDPFVDIMEVDGELLTVINKINEEKNSPPIERGVSALLAYHETEGVELPDDPTLYEVPTDELNIFAPLRKDGNGESIMADNLETFGMPLLNHSSTQEKVTFVGRLQGKSQDYAANVTQELMKDMQMATHYPPSVDAMPSDDDIAGTIDLLISKIDLKKREKESSSGDSTK